MSSVPEEKIKVGNRLYSRTPGQIEIMTVGEWSLHLMSVSPCGEWQNYKLYRDVERAPKHVFYLSRRTGNDKFHRMYDLTVLEASYEGMADWATSAANGVRTEPPKFTPRNGWNKSAPQFIDHSGSPAVTQGFINAIRMAWDEGWPMSPYAQTKKQGRYAVKILSEMTGLKQGDVALTLDRMIDKKMIYYRSRKGRGGKMHGLSPIDLADPAEHRPRREDEPPKLEDGDGKVLDMIHDHRRRGRPLSFYAQTKVQGRYAPWVMVIELGVDEISVTKTIARLLNAGTIEHRIIDKSAKLKGLVVVNREPSDG